MEKLTAKFNPAGYLNPVSDIVALMTFEHQTQMKTFPEHSPRDRRGRSLRDFGLKTRLIRYPLELHDLQCGIRRAAGRGPRLHLPAVIWDTSA